MKPHRTLIAFVALLALLTTPALATPAQADQIGPSWLDTVIQWMAQTWDALTESDTEPPADDTPPSEPVTPSNDPPDPDPELGPDMDPNG